MQQTVNEILFEIENYQNIIKYYEQKYNSNLNDYAKEIENRASMEQEIDYEEWEIAEGMFASRNGSRSNNPPSPLY